ncbi:MAG: asparagine synthase (glutamine-hydrolyzing) [Bacteroidota bacterium]
MCGIAGILYFNTSTVANPALVKKMTDAMAHRGPNADGFFSEDNLLLGHRRLSVIDLSEGANQPFTDHTQRYHMVFNGELFNFREVKAGITDHVFRTSGDTEVLIEAFARRGMDCLSQFKGMFAFALWDRVEKTLYLVRDRLGVKPLYYYADDHCLVFASEIRAILASGLAPAKLNKAAVANFLQYQSVSPPDSIVSGIHELPAAHFMRVKQGRLEQHCYWDITALNPVTTTDPSVIKKHIYELLQQAVSQRLVSDVPIGAFLSGGIDSSAVVALMSRVSISKPVTFNIAFEEKAFDESAYAEIVAKKFNTEHHKIVLKPEAMLEELGHALNAMDTPTGDGINTYVVSKAIKKAGLTVALSGVGGDELFAGYPFFKKYYQLHKQSFAWKASAGLRKLAAGFAGNSKWHNLLATGGAGIADIYPVLRQIVSPLEIEKLTRLKNTRDVVAALLKEKEKAISQFPSFSQVSIAEYGGYTQQTLLKDTDQMGMAVSLEIREPFFDHELIEYVLGIPDKIKYPHYPKQLLVESLGDLLPPEIVHRTKQGFTFPWQIWMKNELKSFCESHIDRICERDFINADNLKKKWTDFLLNDKQSGWMELWLFVILENWLEKNSI